MIKLLILILLTFYSLSTFGCSEDYPCMLYPVYAQSTATPSNSLKEKIKALDAEIASQAAKLIPTINKRLQNKAYIGFIKSKSANSFTLATKAGSYIVNVNDYTEYSSADKKVTIDTFEVDDYIAALGDVDESEVLTAKRVLRFPSPGEKEKRVFGGVVTAISGSTITLRTFTGQIETVAVDAKTSYKLGSEVSDLSAVKTTKAIYVVALPTSKQAFARFVYIVPYTLTLPKSKTATRSAGPRP